MNENNNKMSNETNNYISQQITVYKNSKVLIEFLDKLNCASPYHYAHIHADKEENAEGKKQYSLIGILMKDYSKGTGDKAVTVKANISPEEIKFILTRLSAGFSEYEFKQDKIFGIPDEKGYAQVTKVRIIRATTDFKGNIRKMPWYIEIENGKGIPQKNVTGGTYMKANSYVQETKVSANLADMDLFKLLSKVCSYINVWEAVYGPYLIGEAKQLAQEFHQKRLESQQTK